MTQKRYVFTIQISGIGENEQEAWLDATESFDQDPGSCPKQHEQVAEEGVINGLCGKY